MSRLRFKPSGMPAWYILNGSPTIPPPTIVDRSDKEAWKALSPSWAVEAGTSSATGWFKEEED